MSVQALLTELRGLGVELVVEGDHLTVDAPAGTITEDLRAALAQNKPKILKLLVWERRKLEQAHRLGCVARWSRHPWWIELHNPTTGDWYEVKASECLPGVLAEADRRRKGGAA